MKAAFFYSATQQEEKHRLPGIKNATIDGNPYTEIKVFDDSEDIIFPSRHEDVILVCVVENLTGSYVSFNGGILKDRITLNGIIQ